MNASLQAHRIETTLTQNGTLTPDGLPFQAGEAVEVIVLPKALPTPPQDRYPCMAPRFITRSRPSL